MRLTGWQPFAGQILRCDLPAGVQGELARFRQLVLDGTRQRRARWPKFEPDNPIHGGWAFVDSGADARLGQSSLKNVPSTCRTTAYSGTGSPPSCVVM